MDGDTFAFALLLGLPLLAISWVVTAVLLYIMGWRWALPAGLVLITAWPVYYVSMTAGKPGFVEGLPLLLFTLPAMLAGFALALVTWRR